MKYLYIWLLIPIFCIPLVQAEIIYDEARDRGIPVKISYPINEQDCTIESKCAVAFLSAGYGVAHTQYSFLEEQLRELGYMVVSVAHELPQDPPLSVTGNLYETRRENWVRGAKTLAFLKSQLQSRYSNYAFNELLLIGHSNGGDISSWLGNEKKPYIKSIITLDHRRVPLPRNTDINIFSIRASDFAADEGVLPTKTVQSDICVVQIPDARHNDLSDHGPRWLQDKIKQLVHGYLVGQSCAMLNKA